MSLFMMAANESDPAKAAAELAAEYFAVFGEDLRFYPPNAQYYATINALRQNYTHESILDRSVPLFISNGPVQTQVIRYQPMGHGFWGSLSDAGKTVANLATAAAPFVAMIPGLGTIAGAGLEFGGTLALGNRIDDVLVNTVGIAIPPQYADSYHHAVDLSYKLARGENVSKETIATIRDEGAGAAGLDPDATKVAFDIGTSIGSARGLQDAGYQAFRNWTKNTDSETARIVEFADDVRVAKRDNVPLKDFIIGQAKNEFFAAVPAAQQADVLAKAIDFLLHNPREMVDPQIAMLAERVGVPIEAMRAAVICILRMSDGSLLVDPVVAPEFAPRTVVASIGRLDASGFTARNAGLQAQGAAIAAADPEVGAIRNLPTYPPQVTTNWEWRRGFDIGTAISQGSAIPGPSQDAVRSSIPTISQYNGFNAARELQYAITRRKAVTAYAGLITLPPRKDTTMATAVGTIGRLGGNTVEERTRNQALAAQGKAMAAADPRIATARGLNPDGMYTLGFDVGTALCAGSSIPGPGQTAVRNSLNAGLVGQNGFDVAQALQHGITKARASGTATAVNPAVATGQLVAMGVAGNGQSVDQKAATLTTAASNGQVKTGIASTVGFFSRAWHGFLAFFGLE